jgi:hypothetical protein
VGRCVCGREVELTGNTNSCDCGREYNWSGQELAPRDQWGWEFVGFVMSDLYGPDPERMPGDEDEYLP